MSIIKSILKKAFFQKELEEARKEGFRQGQNSEKNEYWRRKAEIGKIEDEMLLGKPVIFKSNEWQELVVGEIVKIEYPDNNISSPFYVIKDYIKNKEIATLCRPIPFSKQKLVILGKLNPDEYCALFYEGKSSFREFRKHPDYGQPGRNTFTNYENWQKKLTENGFYEKFKDFLEEQDQKSKEDWEDKVERFSKNQNKL